MAKRRSKKRTHVGAANPGKGSGTTSKNNDAVDGPKNMVIRMGAGTVGPSISQLVADVRKTMEPNTASRLKERRANKLRDYITMAPPLGVSHLLLFSRSPSGNTNLRIAASPRGPTLSFRVEKYSLSKDVQKVQRHPRGGGKEFLNAPLLVMNNFSTAAAANSKVPKHLESMTTAIFHSLFPSINPQTTPLSSIRRVLLLDRDQTPECADSLVLNFRHYAIDTKPAGISKPLKRLGAAEKLLGAKRSKKGGLPNLSRLQDIADYMIGGEDDDVYVTDGATTGSEADTDAEVEILENAPRKVPSAAAKTDAGAEQQGEKRTAAPNETRVSRKILKLAELGPRMRLRLVKLEEGLCQGQVMWHDHKHKSEQQTKELKEKWDRRRKEKEARKKQQKENVEKKKKARVANSAGQADGEADEEMDLSDLSSDGWDDDVEMGG